MLLLISFYYCKGVDETFIDMVESHSVYNINTMQINMITFHVKYAANPTPTTIEWQHGNGIKISSKLKTNSNFQYEEFYNTTFDEFSTTLRIKEFQFNQPDKFSLFIRNGKNVSMNKTFYVGSEGK